MAITKHKGIVYTRTDIGEPAFKLDIWDNGSATAKPVVLFAHGGGWFGGARDENNLTTLATAIANHGFAWVSFDYGLTPTFAMPAMVRHAFGALRWCRANAAAYHFDPDNIAVSGSSAGSIMAAQMAGMWDSPNMPGNFGRNTDESNEPQALLAISGAVYDPNLLDLSTDTKACLTTAFGCGPFPDNGSLALYLPQHHFKPTTPPALVIHAANDQYMPVAHATGLTAAINNAGGDATLIVNADMTHGPENANVQLAAIFSFLDAAFAA